MKAVILAGGRGSRISEETSIKPKRDVPSVTRMEIFTSEPNNVHAHGKPLRIEFDVNMPHTSEGAGVSFQILDNLAKPIMASWAFPSVTPLFHENGKHTVCCQIPALRLYMGDYSLAIGLADEGGPEIVADTKKLTKEVKYNNDCILRDRLEETVDYWRRFCKIND